MSTPVGFQVHPPTIDGAGQAATRIGGAISQLSAQVRPDSELPNALTIGSTMWALVPVWEQHLQATGDEVKQDGNDLSATHRNYLSTEDAVARSFDDVHELGG